MIRKLDVLVHPFYLSDSDRPYTGETNSKRLELYKKRIDRISSSRGHYLVIEPHTRPKNTQNQEEAYNELLGYARKKMGERVIEHVTSAPYHDEKSAKAVSDKLKRIGYDPNKIKVHFYGEYAEQCLLNHLRFIAPKIIPRARRRQAISVLLKYSGSLQFPNYRPVIPLLRQREKYHDIVMSGIKEVMDEIRAAD
jgi:hypothetical protein